MRRTFSLAIPVKGSYDMNLNRVIEAQQTVQDQVRDWVADPAFPHREMQVTRREWVFEVDVEVPDEVNLYGPDPIVPGATVSREPWTPTPEQISDFEATMNAGLGPSPGYQREYNQEAPRRRSWLGRLVRKTGFLLGVSLGGIVVAGLLLTVAALVAFG